MIKIEIQTKKYAWIAKLSVEIKGEIHSKELKGTFEEKKEILEIIFSNLKTLKNLSFFTNDEDIKELLQKDNYNVEIITETFDFSEIINYKEFEDPSIPEELNKSFEEICIFDTKELNQIAVSTYFVKAYLFFKDNKDKIKEIKLLSDLKNKGIYDKDILIEDILQTIEETFLI